MERLDTSDSSNQIIFACSSCPTGQGSRRNEPGRYKPPARLFCFLSLSQTLTREITMYTVEHAGRTIAETSRLNEAIAIALKHIGSLWRIKIFDRPIPVSVATLTPIDGMVKLWTATSVQSTLWPEFRRSSGFSSGVFELLDINGRDGCRAWIRTTTDLEGRFNAICSDTGERLQVQGWNCQFDSVSLKQARLESYA